MKNPFIKKMPLGTDIRIRLRLLRAQVVAHPARSLGVVLVPALTAWVFLVGGVTESTFNEEVFVVEVRAAQEAELQQAAGGIYHVVREISEGSEKPAYVTEVMGETKAVSARVDRVETFQHSDTALALVESNGTERPFEAYLSYEHGESLALHHYGPKETEVPAERITYDAAHDLATLYADYTSLESPAVPVLPEDANFVSVNEAAGYARFETKVNEDVTVASHVDLTSKLVVEEIIYVTSDTDEYEMTRISYTNREVLPAEQFDEVFNPSQFEYSIVALREAT
jgi:hypothetical protein